MKKLLQLMFASLTVVSAFGQGYPGYGSGLKLKLNEDGSNYIRFINWHQVWMKYNENNDGSTLAGNPIDHSTDMAIRRSRFLTYAQLNDRFLILTHFGINNQNAFSGGSSPALNGKKPQLFLHDAYTEYKVYKSYLSIGAGLHYWNGISRSSNASTLNFLGLDAPIFNWANIDKSDQFGRYLGIYAKGKIKKLDYRVALNDAFQANETKAIATEVSDYSPFATKWNQAGYFNYQFFDQESNLLPFMVGTYLGSKKVFNIGAGFQHQKDAMWSKTTAGDTIFESQLMLSGDVFLDLPLNKERKDAITFYGSYSNYNFGKNYVRNIGILNTADGGGSLKGNALPTIGTGTIAYAQVGYLMPVFSNKFRLQPFASIAHSRFEGLKNSAGEIVPVNVIDAGMNVYLSGHHSKLTFNYRARPDFTNINAIDYKNELTLQFMVYL
jgi:hypothetical protein